MDQNDSLNEAAELAPIELPGRTSAPSVEERLLRVESLLNLND